MGGRHASAPSALLVEMLGDRGLLALRSAQEAAMRLGGMHEHVALIAGAAGGGVVGGLVSLTWTAGHRATPLPLPPGALGSLLQTASVFALLAVLLTLHSYRSRAGRLRRAVALAGRTGRIPDGADADDWIPALRRRRELLASQRWRVPLLAGLQVLVAVGGVTRGGFWDTLFWTVMLVFWIVLVGIALRSTRGERERLGRLLAQLQLARV